MRETTPVTPRASSAAWPPGGWSLRTKVAAVLLLPVIVAITLAGARIRSELADAGSLSTVRDQLPVVRSTVDLAGLIGEEMVASATGTVAGAGTQIDAVNAKITEVRRHADFTELPADAERTLNTTLGELGGVRSAGNGVPSAKTSAYQDIITSLSRLVPVMIVAANRADLDDAADNIAALMEIRGALSVQEALFRAGPADPEASVPAAARSVAESAVLGDQIQRRLDPASAARFASATARITDRDRAVNAVLAGGSPQQLAAQLPSIASERAALGDQLTGMTNSLSATVDQLTNDSRSTALRDTALVLGALLGALAIALLMARSLLAPMRRLHTAALSAAGVRLPETIDRIHRGEVVPYEDIEPVDVHTDEEIGQLARAFDEMQRQAVRLAGEQAELRKQVSEMFMTLARRSQSMVELQLTVLEDLESNERDPKRLDDLFRLDHLATRLRRNGENLQVLAGGAPSRRDFGPVSMVEVLRGATSEVKDYSRISLVDVPNGAVRSQAAADIVHILAELLENATRFSPPEEKVILTAGRGADGGLLVEVVDHGLGMTPEDLTSANQRLAAAGELVGPETMRRMGLFVVGRLAAPHAITVRLRATMSRAGRAGITASVHVPGELIIADGGAAPQPLVSGFGHQQAPAANGNGHPPARTPIFERLVSSWFGVDEPDTAGPANWTTPADEVLHAAESAFRRPASAPVAPSGLPTRTPGAQLAPGAAAPREPKPEATGFRDPVAIRNNLSRHYNGMRAARQRAAATDPQEGS